MKTGALVWSGIKTFSLTSSEKKNIEQQKISGLILFKRNIKSLRQFYELCKEIYFLKHKPLIAIDREGGLVDRLKHLPEFSDWPQPEVLARTCSLREIKQTAFFIGRPLSALGVFVNFAPCFDIPLVKSPLFKGRLMTSKKALAFTTGLKKAGLAMTAKHFPGHGGVLKDSHKTLPIDANSLQEIKRTHLPPFKLAIKKGLDLIMTAHVLYPSCDKNHPATISPFFLKKLLRKELKFKGLIVSDDLDMKALNKRSLKQNVLLALKAGGDVLLKCQPGLNNFRIAEWIKKEALKDKHFEQDVKDKIKRVKVFQQKFPLKKFPSFTEYKNLVLDPKARKWQKELKNRFLQ